MSFASSARPSSENGTPRSCVLKRVIIAQPPQLDAHERLAPMETTLLHSVTYRLRLFLLGHPLPSVGLTIEGIHQTRFATFLSGMDITYRAVLAGRDRIGGA